MSCLRVAPPGRWSRFRTRPVLPRLGAVAGCWIRLARLLALAFSRTRRSAAGPRSGAKLWAAAQIRETATFRLVNFLTGFWSGNAFQISTRRGPGQRFAKRERSPAPLKRAAPGLIWLGEVKTAMWLLRSMVNVSTLGFSLSRQYRD